MKRRLKNIIMILIIIAVCVCSYYTMKNTQKTNSKSSTNKQQLGEPPAKPDGENNSNSSNSQNSGSQMGEPPAKPNEENNNNMQEPKEMQNMNQQNSNNGIRMIQYVMFGIEGVIVSTLVIYLVMSRFNKYTFRETLNETNTTIIFVLLTLILTTILTVAQVLTANYTTSESDKSVILVENGGNLTLDGAEVSKTGGDSSNTENSSEL